MPLDIQRLVPYPEKPIDDADWFNISEKFGLPIEARPAIEKAIFFFALMRSTEYTPAETKARLLRAERNCEKLAAQLKSLRSDRLAQVGLALASDHSFEIAMQAREPAKLSEMSIEQLEILKETLSVARSRIKSAKRGDWTSAVMLALFVGQLDEIKFEFTGTRLRRDSKGKATGRDFVEAACDAAGVKVTAESIDGALRQVIEGRKRREITPQKF